MLSVRNISKIYENNIILQDISFDLNNGEILGLVGKNGSGKSTIISIIAQTIKPDKGEIFYNNTNVLGDKKFLRQYIGYVPQSNSLISELTVYEQLKLWKYITGRDILNDKGLCQMLGLDEMFKKKIYKLSGGMKKRVSFALALAETPPILLMDEAFSALDELYKLRLIDWFKMYKKRGGCALWCSHDKNELDILCDKIITINNNMIGG